MYKKIIMYVREYHENSFFSETLVYTLKHAKWILIFSFHAVRHSKQRALPPCAISVHETTSGLESRAPAYFPVTHLSLPGYVEDLPYQTQKNAKKRSAARITAADFSKEEDEY